MAYDLSLCALLRAPNSLPTSRSRRPFRLRSGRFGHRRTAACRSTQGGYAMRTFDLAPLYRSTVGFDRLFSMLDGLRDRAPATRPTTSSGPARTPTASRRGRRLRRERAFDRSEGKHADHQGRQAGQGRAERRGALSGHRRARFRARLPACRLRPGQSATSRTDLLHVDLVREIPEAKKPRRSRSATVMPSRRWSTPKPRPKFAASNANGGARTFRGALF